MRTTKSARKVDRKRMCFWTNMMIDEESEAINVHIRTRICTRYYEQRSGLCEEYE